MSNGGFVNSRTGSYVSSARAHQHVGESFGGYTKARSASGNYYMKESSGNSTPYLPYLNITPANTMDQLANQMIDNAYQNLYQRMCNEYINLCMKLLMSIF